LASQHETIPDQDGVEVTDVAETYAAARQAIKEFRSESPSTEWRGWRLDVTDASGAIVFSISLDEPIH
jgi:hypothetical protein